MRALSSVFVTLVAVLAVIAAGLATVVAGQGAGLPAPSVVHEWGTFTTVAGPDGQPVQWAPFSGPQDLPCFVTKLNPYSVKVGAFLNFDGEPLTSADFLPALRATVRMETPLLYFYSPVETTAGVTVGFPQGVITEWYPQASVPNPAASVQPNMTNGWISWNNVHVRPGMSEAFPTEKASSHYYAARATDAAPVQVGNQSEKFLFYRGLATFPVGLTARLDGSGAVTIAPTGNAALPQAILFESDGHKMGYRVLGRVDHAVTMARPVLSLDLSSGALREELETMLRGQGLYGREAKAMVETWRDSWFEPGLRLMYVTPRSTVDAVLPLTINPAPSQIARVFVGRFELITPEMRAAVGTALDEADRVTLEHYGRFLDPIANQVLASMTPAERTKATSTLRLVASQFAAKAAAAVRSCQ